MKIKNGDMPVTPLVNENGHPFHASQVCFENVPLVSGLSKREAFAMAAMQGILASKYYSEFCADDGGAGAAVLHADYLLKELSK